MISDLDLDHYVVGEASADVGCPIGIEDSNGLFEQNHSELHMLY